jgi:antitoxin component YwqK of YwqJK toxin-antitoxin module
MKPLLTLFLFLFYCSLTFAQTEEDTVDYSVPQYDKLCTIMGGDSIRYQNGQKATGFFKDFYPSGRLKHKGYYDQGQIITVFTNYYENGQVERDFKSKTERRGTLEVFYKSGALLSRVEWIGGESLKWEDYYPYGQLEFAEEFNKGLDYYLYMRFYFETGKPQILFELTDEKARTYSYKEYYPNGQIKECGNKVQNEALNDYQLDGKWSYYDENGKLTLEEEYTHGQLINDKSYE